jgi:hypothetical protein
VAQHDAMAIGRDIQSLDNVRVVCCGMYVHADIRGRHHIVGT